MDKRIPEWMIIAIIAIITLTTTAAWTPEQKTADKAVRVFLGERW